MNAYFKEASYGKIGFSGVIAGWIDVEREMTAEEMLNEKDDLFQMVTNSDKLSNEIDFDSIDIWILYGWASSGIQEVGTDFRNRVTIIDTAGDEKIFLDVR